MSASEVVHVVDPRRFDKSDDESPMMLPPQAPAYFIREKVDGPFKCHRVSETNRPVVAVYSKSFPKVHPDLVEFAGVVTSYERKPKGPRNALVQNEGIVTLPVTKGKNAKEVVPGMTVYAVIASSGEDAYKNIKAAGLYTTDAKLGGLDLHAVGRIVESAPRGHRVQLSAYRAAGSRFGYTPIPEEAGGGGYGEEEAKIRELASPSGSATDKKAPGPNVWAKASADVENAKTKEKTEEEEEESDSDSAFGEEEEEEDDSASSSGGGAMGRRRVRS